MSVYDIQGFGSSQTISLAVATLGFAAVLVWHVSRVGVRPAKAPPGPSTLPVIGNLHLMPESHAWLQYFKWAKQYG